MLKTPYYAIATSPSRLRFFAPVDNDLGAGAGAGAGGDGEAQKDSELGFPSNTAPKDMEPEQRAAYWQHRSRQNEDRVRAFGQLSPEQVAELQAERDRLVAAGQTDSEKAIEEAREAGRAEVRSILAAERVKSAFTTALAGRVPDAGALLDLDRSKYVKGDQADADAIKAWVEEHSTEKTTETTRRTVDLGQGRGRGTTTPNKGVGAGRDLFSGSKKSTTTS
ncbi:hypothetical protein [Frigoribacterium sp. VKM Ac-2530]|uniref:hypothetical protein n=1 Tax=Frigoribacterium sp. VKM Ac-2530 TaxID=2783822 RepID=UPI00188B1765|nr:hypothetical protein [Frigoribacterium sp. VKM Ac-2530]MBF4578951.1 hypothetical protein [Frigoribacterium sp. VKM Ac-2530]